MLRVLTTFDVVLMNYGVEVDIVCLLTEFVWLAALLMCESGRG